MMWILYQSQATAHIMFWWYFISLPCTLPPLYLPLFSIVIDWCIHHILYPSLLGNMADIIRYDNQITRLPHLAGNTYILSDGPNDRLSLRTSAVRSHEERMAAGRREIDNPCECFNCAPRMLRPITRWIAADCFKAGVLAVGLPWVVWVGTTISTIYLHYAEINGIGFSERLCEKRLDLGNGLGDGQGSKIAVQEEWMWSWWSLGHLFDKMSCSIHVQIIEKRWNSCLLFKAWTYKTDIIATKY